MNKSADQQLLREYAAQRSEAAFNEFVNRNIDFVYSTALRITRDPHLAQDVTQAVFIVVARDAHRLTNLRAVAGWLHQATRNTAANAIRADLRRRAREKESASMLAPTDSEPWPVISRHLDDALSALPEADREAILLRFFQQKSLAKVGLILGISEDAAQKRVARALEKVRAFLSAREITVTVAGLATILGANAVQAAPLGVTAAILSAASAGSTSLATAILIPATKAFAMTTLQKTTVVLAFAAAIGFGIKERHEKTKLRAEVRAWRQENSALPDQSSTRAQQQGAAHAVADPSTPPAAASAIVTDEDWSARLASLNTKDWREAFSLGQKLSALPPERGLDLLQKNWSSITNNSARQQLLKAFSFAFHEKLPAVLHLALTDSAPEVQNWALIYLKDLALQDFSTDYNAALAWLGPRTHAPIATAFADALYNASLVFRQAQGDELYHQLTLLKDSSDWLAKFPEGVTPARLDETLASIIQSQDPRAVELAIAAAARLQVDDQWRQTVILPRLSVENPWRVRVAAARALGHSKSEWALPPLLDMLEQAIHASAEPDTFSVASALSDLGSPRAIPQMIALMESDPTGNSNYSIGYYGLHKLTGVTYDEKHDATWWKQWWEANAQRFQNASPP